MSKELDIQKGFSQLKKRGVSTFLAKVESVDKNEATCSVSADELVYTDVKLCAKTEEGAKGFHIYPKIGSEVLISPIDEDIHSLYVEFFSEIESFDLQIEKVNLQIDQEGFLLKKENETLKKLMVDLLQEIQKMKFTTNAGPTILLVNKPQFMDIETRFKDFLK